VLYVVSMSNATKATQLVNCPKCSGKGTIRAFMHRDSGKCFQCGGAGRIEVDAPSAAQALNMIRGSLIHTADIVLRALDDDNEERAWFYLDRMVDKMFSVGTDRARQVLRHLAAGRCLDDDGFEMIQVGPAKGRRAAERLVRLGREATTKAAA
jgi:hypothetical protein